MGSRQVPSMTTGVAARVRGDTPGDACPLDPQGAPEAPRRGVAYDIGSRWARRGDGKDGTLSASGAAYPHAMITGDYGFKPVRRSEPR
jgi:hypothetical protein